ncbi:MAG: hypothetical protein ACXWG3_10225 [Usitatibacter sp.]
MPIPLELLELLLSLAQRGTPSRASSQELDGWLSAHVPIITQYLNGFAEKNGDARRA